MIGCPCHIYKFRPKVIKETHIVRIFEMAYFLIGYGRITEIDGNKLTVDFEKAGRKRVVASFLTRV